MNTKKIRGVGMGALVLLWAVLAGTAWFGPRQEYSTAERRKLKEFPEVSAEKLLNGDFTRDFDAYTLDQFPMRDQFRTVKSVFYYYGMHHKDHHDIYLEDGYAAKLEYPLRQPSVDHALERFGHLYEKYLKDSGGKILAAIVPDKGYYLAQANGYPAMDYDSLFRQVEEKMPWAEFVNLRDSLTIEDYYRTDTHWKQENLLDIAEKISLALGVTPPKKEDFRSNLTDVDYYGVYYGHAALPMKPDSLTILESDLLSQCRVYDYEKKDYGSVYDMEKLHDRDPYEVYLSGARKLLRIENPQGKKGKELIVFRDSFGSSLTPLLVQDYETVTLVDIRYIASDLLEAELDFHGQDVLFLYNTLVINNSATLK